MLQHVLLLELKNRQTRQTYSSWTTLAASWNKYNIESHSYYFQDSSWTFSDLFAVYFTGISSTTKSSFVIQITFYCPHCELCEIRWTCVFLFCIWPQSVRNTLPNSLKNEDSHLSVKSVLEVFLFRKLYFQVMIWETLHWFYCI